MGAGVVRGALIGAVLLGVGAFWLSFTALADLAFRNLAGWLAVPPEADARDLTLVRAKALGART